MKITPYLNNAKKHDKKQVEQIADSMGIQKLLKMVR